MTQKIMMAQQSALIPGSYFAHIVDFVEEQGLSSECLYEIAYLDKKSFNPQHDCISETTLFHIVQQAKHLCQLPAFALLVGSRFSVSSFGTFSTAMLSCNNLQTALKLMERYSSLALPIVQCSARVDCDVVTLDFVVHSRHAEMQQIVVEACIGNLQKSFSILLGRLLPIESITVTYAEPNYASLYRDYVDCPIYFNGDSNRVRIASVYCNLPFVTANVSGAKISIEQCELELIEAQESISIKHKVQNMVRFYIDRNPTIVDIAAKLNLTERTMRRRLNDEGVSFREILKDVRHELAIYYLGQTSMQISQISEKLGYQELSNFRAAFRAWEGCSPRVWRNEYALSDGVEK